MLTNQVLQHLVLQIVGLLLKHLLDHLRVQLGHIDAVTLLKFQLILKHLELSQVQCLLLIQKVFIFQIFLLRLLLKHLVEQCRALKLRHLHVQELQILLV